MEEDITRKGMHLNDIFKSYFEKDVKNLARFRGIQLFRDLLLLLFSRVGSKLDIARLASELGTSRETIYSYLSFLQDTFFITLVPSFTGSMDKLVSKAKKVYFCDTGILNEFAKVSEGALFENAVYNNLQGFNNIHYYQKKSGREIDFILDSKIGLEVKLKGIPSDFERLKTISAKIGLENCYVVSKEFVDSDGFISVIDL